MELPGILELASHILAMIAGAIGGDQIGTRRERAQSKGPRP